MKTRAIVITWIAFALPILILAALLWRGPSFADAQQRFVWKVQSSTLYISVCVTHRLCQTGEISPWDFYQVWIMGRC
jgi:hypothetical protein